jgi:general stress protein 26
MKRKNIDRVWDLVGKVGVCMLTTHFRGGLRARPVEVRPDRAQGLIFVLTDIHGRKGSDIETSRDVCLVFVDGPEKAYLSIVAEAEVVDDHAKAAEIWKTSDGLWWSGPDDPNVRVLRIAPRTAELWDGPSSTVVAAFEFVKARVIGAKPNLGENRKTTVPMA